MLCLTHPYGNLTVCLFTLSQAQARTSAAQAEARTATESATASTAAAAALRQRLAEADEERLQLVRSVQEGRGSQVGPGGRLEGGEC